MEKNQLKHSTTNVSLALSSYYDIKNLLIKVDHLEKENFSLEQKIRKLEMLLEISNSYVL